MSGDYTRFSFVPRRNHAGVLLQQGRVTLDADWNELVELRDRRWRAETVDIIGRAVVPRTDLDPGDIPSGFRIRLAGTSFEIGRGRSYVDGLLAENHADAPERFDDLLAEPRGTTLPTYEAQPYLPFPPPLAASGRHLVYLDVWHREVTAVQNPDLVERAIGIDTATRMQTVWQVRVLQNVGPAVTCETDPATIPGWADATRPSGGRLTTGVVTGVASVDPCVIAEAGGYRGTENRLYRVEIHAGGAPGTARFKWSRDDASVATAVTSLDTSQPVVQVARIGRDQTLRFTRGDWVEITDDVRELHGEPGVIRQIVDDPDEVERTLRLNAALPLGTPSQAVPFVFDATNPAARHTRITLWHQSGLVRDTAGTVVVDLNAAGSGGLIPVPAAAATEIVLEDGVTVSFALDPAGGAFEVGDYWVFAARTVDGSVERLVDAPPRGIHHHHQRLAVIEAPATVFDCREFWPPEFGTGEGCCTAVVHPGESIQAAIDGLPGAGGCVCLKAGTHPIDAPIAIRRSRVLLHGESPATVIEHTGLARALVIGDADAVVHDVTVHDIELSGIAKDAVVVLDRCRRVVVARCTIRDTANLVGVLAMGVDQVDIVDGVVEAASGVIVDEAFDVAGDVAVCRNTMQGPTAESEHGMLSAGVVGISVRAPIPCRIEHNVVRDFATGVEVHRGDATALVADNAIFRSDGPRDDQAPGELEEQRRMLDDQRWGIDVARAGCIVRANVVDMRTPIWGGIRVNGPRSLVADNRLVAPHGLVTQPGGIYCTAVSPLDGSGADAATVRGNTLEGAQLGIVVSRVRDAVVDGNRIGSPWEGKLRDGWQGVALDAAEHAIVAANVVRMTVYGCRLESGERNRLANNDVVDASIGMHATWEQDVDVRDNVVRACEFGGILLTQGRGAARLTRNRVINCGWSPLVTLGTTAAGMSPTVAIFVSLPIADPPHATTLTIEGCEVVDAGIAPDAAHVSTVPVVAIAAIVADCHVTGTRVTYTEIGRLDPANLHRALLVAPVERGFGKAMLVDNVFKGWGNPHLVQVSMDREDSFERIMFSNNDNEHFEPGEKSSTVGLIGKRVIAMGNHVRAPKGVIAMDLSNCGRVTLVGNIANGPYDVPTAVRPQPTNDYNYP